MKWQARCVVCYFKSDIEDDRSRAHRQGVKHANENRKPLPAHPVAMYRIEDES